MYLWEPVGALISTVLSQLILGTRIFAIYAQDKRVGFLIALILVAEIAVGGFSISTTSAPPNIPGPSKPPCGAVMGPDSWLISFWSIPILYDTIAFLLTAWKAFEFWRREIDTPLFSIIWRDGVFYFFAIFSMNVINIVIFLTVPKTLRAINLTPTLIFEIVLSCRLVLNLRGPHGMSPSAPRRPTGAMWSDNSKTRSNPSHDQADRTIPDKDVIYCTPYSPSTELGPYDRVKFDPHHGGVHVPEGV
ncbi:hypothetical protein BU17DRAFT_53993 [Hysterangium stoloniferum]|nr:hypothetical protein BU17DRAFT_53993 [Hysterangium stoloniferum]